MANAIPLRQTVRNNSPSPCRLASHARPDDYLDQMKENES